MEKQPQGNSQQRHHVGPPDLFKGGTSGGSLAAAGARNQLDKPDLIGPDVASPGEVGDHLGLAPEGSEMIVFAA